MQIATERKQQNSLIGGKIGPCSLMDKVLAFEASDGSSILSRGTKIIFVKNYAMLKSFFIPQEIQDTTEALEKAGFEAYLVGGCVRDLIVGNKPKDWDITTNATPNQIIAIFLHTFYENTFGTVGVVIDQTEDETLKTVEVTPYRLESEYSDNRRPYSVQFAQKLEDDLKRRDFTMNALAYSVSQRQMIDLYNGQNDIEEKTIRTVGEASERFSEDALRIMRAVRFYCQLSFEISQETERGILENAHLLQKISRERVRDEFTKIIMSDKPMDGLLALKKFNLLNHSVMQK